jgi:hypothetical protein
MMEDEMDDLAKRIAALEAELAALKAEVKPAEPTLKAKGAWPKYDPTEGFRLPPSAAKAMAAVVPDVKDRSKLPDTRRASYPEPGGFGPPPRSTGLGAVERGSGWIEPSKLEGPPGLRYVDQQIDVQNQIDKRDLERRLGGAGHGSK